MHAKFTLFQNFADSGLQNDPFFLVSRIRACHWKHTPFFAKMGTSMVYVLVRSRRPGRRVITRTSGGQDHRLHLATLGLNELTKCRPFAWCEMITQLVCYLLPISLCSAEMPVFHMFLCVMKWCVFLSLLVVFFAKRRQFSSIHLRITCYYRPSIYRGHQTTIHTAQQTTVKRIHLRTDFAFTIDIPYLALMG